VTVLIDVRLGIVLPTGRDNLLPYRLHVQPYRVTQKVGWGEKLGTHRQWMVPIIVEQRVEKKKGDLFTVQYFSLSDCPREKFLSAMLTPVANCSCVPAVYLSHTVIMQFY